MRNLKLIFRSFLTLACTLSSGMLVLAVSGIALAAELPADKQLRFVVPYPAGGGADSMARVLAAKLADALGRRIIIDNRVGAAGIVGGELVAKSPPDGLTLMFVVASHAINAASGRKLPYETERDFAPVMLVGWGANLVSTHPSLPVRTVKELIALARARPGEIHYASFGSGSVSHMSGELFKLMARVELVHIPYRGAAPAMIDVVGGQVPLVFGSLISSMTYAREGRLRALAVTSAERSVLVPELPTVAEAGLPDYNTREWWGIFAPAGVRPELIAQLNQELKRALALEDVRKRLASVGAEIVGSNPAQLAAFLKAEIARWRDTIRSAKITID